ncbi:MAG: hypothetical protein ACI8TP_004143, partial [Acidimicrobiales bacterium]
SLRQTHPPKKTLAAGIAKNPRVQPEHLCPESD